jgi:hypothetical protein
LTGDGSLIRVTSPPRSQSQSQSTSSFQAEGRQFESGRAHAESGRLRPGFSFVDAAGDVIVWKHLGMLSKKSCSESWEWKLAWCEENGLLLGQNLSRRKMNRLVASIKSS